MVNNGNFVFQFQDNFKLSFSKIIQRLLRSSLMRKQPVFKIGMSKIYCKNIFSFNCTF